MTRSLFFQLMRKDLTQFRRNYPSKLFDTCFLFFTNVIVFGYFMPSVGVSESFGPFILVGAIASFGLFDIVGSVSELIFDIEGDRKITYTLSMPLPSSAVFGQLALKWALCSFLICLPLFPIGKLLLWNQFDLTKINLVKLILIFPTISIFFGTFSLWLASVLKKIQSISSLFLRVINPLFMFGCYFFSWRASFDLSHLIGYAILINPMIYVMEGMRSATLGSEGFLPFWISFSVLWAFNLVLFFNALRRLRHRLDCV